jgi:hypothetical protein
MSRSIIRIDRVLVLWLASLVLTGCAGEAPPAVGPSHPASTDAPQAPVTVISKTLEVRAPPALAAAPLGEGKKGMPDHGMSGMKMPGDLPAQHSSQGTPEAGPATAPGARGG